MRRHIGGTALLVLVSTGLPAASRAQSVTAPAPQPLPANDSIFRRARRLVSEGNGVAGRAVIDSVLQVAPDGTPTYGNALFWRGALAETAADAERDYRRVIVEYPLSPYADDALLSLAELEQARGDRTAAYQHLQRFVREHPQSPARARAGLGAARLAFEQRDVTRGCAMIAEARASAGTGDVELRNQIDYYGGRCPTAAAVASGAPPAAQTPAPAVPAAATPSMPSRTPSVVSSSTPAPAASPGSPGSPAASTPRAPTTPPVAVLPTPSVSAAVPVSRAPTLQEQAAPASVDSTRPAAASNTAPKTGDGAGRVGWTIQLAAYNTRPDAERLVAKLANRGVKARISGDAKPFRVRLDFYPSRQAAVTAVADLKQRGIIGFVTDEVRPGGATSR